MKRKMLALLQDQPKLVKRILSSHDDLNGRVDDGKFSRHGGSAKLSNMWMPITVEYKFGHAIYVDSEQRLHGYETKHPLLMRHVP